MVHRVFRVSRAYKVYRVSKDKMVEPAYQELKAEDVTHVTKDGVTAIVIAGQALGVESKVYTRTPTHYIHFSMEKNSVLEHRVPVGWNAFIYTLEGEALFGGKQAKHGAHHTLVLDQHGTGVRVETKDSTASFVIICGKPLNEPIVQHGPFVMNTRQEIQQTFRDYQEGRNGFERAPGWSSEIGRTLLR